jgi:HlyD family secretion protein
LNAQSTQNVVVYTVEVNVENAAGRLLPYMTANVQFNVHRDAGVLLVPNAALRWYPGSAAEVDPSVRAKWKPVDEQDEQAATPPPVRKPKLKPERHGTVWVRDAKFVRPVDVKLGPTDDQNTEISPTASSGISEGEEVVVGDVDNTGGADDERDPFLPKMNRKK